MKEIKFMTAKKTDFKELPKITELPEREREFDSLIILPDVEFSTLLFLKRR